jgi:hypothetical protein
MVNGFKRCLCCVISIVNKGEGRPCVLSPRWSIAEFSWLMKVLTTWDAPYGGVEEGNADGSPDEMF